MTIQTNPHQIVVQVFVRLQRHHLFLIQFINQGNNNNISIKIKIEVH